MNSRHRLFAELIEQGTRSTLKIPSHPPSLTPLTLNTLTTAAATAPDDALRMLGLNPYQALQHPGFYYYMAARCTERRRQRFLDAVELEVRLVSYLFLRWGGVGVLMLMGD